MMWSEFILIAIIIVGMDIVYTRMEAVNKEITHILTMLALVIVTMVFSAENTELKKQLKERTQQIKIELVIPEGIDADQLRAQLAEMALTLNSEVSSATTSMDK